MSGPLEQIKLVSSELLSAAVKRRKISGCLRKRGFVSLGKGAWLGHRGDDVVSGLLLEGSPSDTYISSFILPIFDELKFVSWSLGRRIVHCSANGNTEDECQRAVCEYLREIAPVNSSNKLIEYLDVQCISGFYPIWVRYICYAKEGFLQEAREYLSESKQIELHQSTRKKFGEIAPAVDSDDRNEIAQVFERWKRTSRAIFGEGNFELNA